MPVVNAKPKKPKLTARQAEIHAYMLEYQKINGAPPSMRDIADNFDFSSTNGVRDHMDALLRKRVVHHYPGRARGWVALDVPVEVAA